MDYGKKAQENYWWGFFLIVIGMPLMFTQSWVFGIIGGLLVLTSFAMTIRLLRCPYCKKMIDMRNQSFCCKCGGDLRNGPEP